MNRTLHQWIVAARGGNGFALPLSGVVRVTPSPRICEAPLLPAGYVGVIEFEGEAVPVWDPFPDAGDFLWGATVIIAQSRDGRVGVLSDAPPRVAPMGEEVSKEELAAAKAAASAAPPKVEEEPEEVDWSVPSTKKEPPPAAPVLPSLPDGPMWDKVVRLGGHAVPVIDPARFQQLSDPDAARPGAG